MADEQGVKFSEFPAAETPINADEVVGLHNGGNARFSLANLILLIRSALTSVFVPQSRTINGQALSSDIALEASDVGAVDEAAVGAANGVASLDNTGKVPSSQLPPIASTAADVTYDNTGSGLIGTNVQDAIDELAGGAGGGGVDPETIASVENSTMASSPHPLGSIFYLNDLLYRALADIPVGGTINTWVGGNATQTTIAQNFKRTVTLTSAEYNQLSAAEKAADIVYIVTDEIVDYATQAQLATVESGSTASRAYAVGEYFCWGGVLYQAKAAISSGGTFTPGTNCETVTVGSELQSLASTMKSFEVAPGHSLQINLPNTASRLQCLLASSGVRTTTAVLYYLSLYSANSNYHVINPIVTGSSISVSDSAGTTTITNNHASDTVTFIVLTLNSTGTVNYTVS